MKKYYWSFRKDSELWTDSEDTVMDCVIEAKKVNVEMQYDYKSIFIGESDVYIPSVDIDSITENICCNAESECGEAAEDYYNELNSEISAILEERFNKVLIEVLKEKNAMPKFGTIRDIQEHSLKTGFCGVDE